MRKQSAAARIRKKASVPVPPAYSKFRDPFHNCQVPNSRLLLHAVQDVFPELQQQSKEKTPSSHLGQLLRWKFMSKRKERQRSAGFPPPPPLTSSTHQADTPGSKSASRKRRKRKKKKRQDASAGTTPPTNEEKDDLGSSAAGLWDAVSVESLDQSIHEMQLQQKEQQESSNPPSLDSLPFDDLTTSRVSDKNPETMLSPSTFFDRIQSQTTGEVNAIKKSLQLALPPPSPFPVARITVPPNDVGPESPNIAKTLPASINPPSATPTRPPKLSKSSSSKSPTHEWVPEEGDKPQTETPPGDVIKNPLELPYLLTTVDSTMGLTTTTIDFRIVSSAESPSFSNSDTPLSSVDTTKALLDEWLTRQHLDETACVVDENANPQPHFRPEDFASFVDFLHGKLWSGRHPLGVSWDALKDSCNSVECFACRQDVLQEAEKLEGRAKNTVILNPAHLKDKFETEEETKASVDASFDYVALEEGHHLAAQPIEEDDKDDEQVDLEKCISLVLSEPKQKKSGSPSKMLYFNSISQLQMEDFVEQWLPCGIEEEIMVTTTVTKNGDNNQGNGIQVLSIEKVTEIRTNVLAKERNVQDKLDELRALGHDLQQEMSKIMVSLDSGEPAQNLELRSFPIMRNCDKMCDSYMEKILIILRLTSAQSTYMLGELQLQLWTAYLRTLTKTLKVCDKYYTKVAEEMADQRGVVPKMFISAPLRSLFRGLVEEKFQLWADLGKIFMKQLTSRVLKEWFTLTQWESQHNTTDVPKSSADLDERCHELTKELTGWTDTLLGGRIAEIQRQRVAQTEHMLEFLQKIVEPLAVEYATVERYFPSDRNRYFASLRSNIVLAHGVRNRMRLIDQNEVECMATGVILMWRHVRIMQSRAAFSADLPPLPLQLKSWILQDHRFLNQFHRGDTALDLHDSYQNALCNSGRGGKRRLMCILAGLVYKWLEARCMEWKAEKAEKELLTDFGLAELSGATASNGTAAASQKTSKSGKKSKKKKNKNSSSISASLLDVIPKESGQADSTENTKTNGRDQGPQTEAPDEICNANPVDKASHRQGQEPQTEENEGVCHSVDDQSTGAEQPNYGQKGQGTCSTDSQQGSDDVHYDVEMIDEYESSVSVRTQTGVLSAKDFLVTRMIDLLADQDNMEVISL